MAALRVHLEHDSLPFGDPLGTRFLRTLRIPAYGGSYPPPLRLATFQVRVAGTTPTARPEAWARSGGVFMRVHERETIRFSFDCT